MPGRSIAVRAGRVVLCLLCILALWIPVQLVVGMILAFAIKLSDLTVSALLNPVRPRRHRARERLRHDPAGDLSRQEGGRLAGLASVATPDKIIRGLTGPQGGRGG